MSLVDGEQPVEALPPSLPKDADGLDCVRLGDLEARYLRHPQAREMVGFAEALFTETNGHIPVGDRHFEALWPEAARILATCDAETRERTRRHAVYRRAPPLVGVFQSPRTRGLRPRLRDHRKAKWIADSLGKVPVEGDRTGLDFVTLGRTAGCRCATLR